MDSELKDSVAKAYFSAVEADKIKASRNMNSITN